MPGILSVFTLDALLSILIPLPISKVGDGLLTISLKYFNALSSGLPGPYFCLTAGEPGLIASNS